MGLGAKLSQSQIDDILARMLKDPSILPTAGGEKKEEPKKEELLDDKPVS